MLDKSIPFRDVIMRLPAREVAQLPDPQLPEGFRLRLYRPGDRLNWARTEACVLEFPGEEQAAAHFDKEFMPWEGETARRMCFIEAPDGRAVANAAIWRMAREGDPFETPQTGGAYASLHWVAVQPEFQGLGLGRAVVLAALERATALDPGWDVWLHTQTWSHTAISLYLKLGFRPQKIRTFCGKKNGYFEAAEILRDVMRPEAYARFLDSAE